jgi:hypothetical protein
MRINSAARLTAACAVVAVCAVGAGARQGPTCMPPVVNTWGTKIVGHIWGRNSETVKVIERSQMSADVKVLIFGRGCKASEISSLGLSGELGS